MTRNLIYHCCPLKDNLLWYRNLQQLFARINVFDGKRVIAVSHDPVRCFSMDVVQRALLELWDDNALIKIKLISVPNDRRLREVASFRALLDNVESYDPRQAVFYAHTKGNSTCDSVRGALYWRNMMYSELLDRADHCIDLLRAGYPAVGCNKMTWGPDKRSPYPSELKHGHWMFAGTFFWFRCDAVFNADWRRVPNDRYGAEAWLSGMFKSHECKSVFQPWPEDMYPTPSPYDPKLYIKNHAAIEDIELEHPNYFI